MKRYYGLDFLRLIAMSFVILLHYQQVFALRFDGFNLVDGLYMGELAVEFFFVLSGFCNAHISKKLSSGELEFKDFFKKRILHLMTPLFPAVIFFELCCIVSELLDVIPEGIEYSRFEIWDTFSVLFGFNASEITTFPIANSHTWFICVLIECFIVFYLAVLLAKKLRIPENLVFYFVAVFNVYVMEKDLKLPFMNYSIGRGLSSFFVGLICYDIINKTKANKRSVITLLLLAFSIAAIIYKYKNYNEAVYYYRYCFIFIFFPLLISLFTLPWMVKLFSWKGWGKIADVTLNIYLWHLNVISLFLVVMYAKGIKEEAASLKYVLIIYFTCIAVGVITNLIEKKILNGNKEH